MKTVKEFLSVNIENDYLVKCIRCRNKHFYSERLVKPRKKEKSISDIVCPKCQCKTTIDV